MNFQGKATLVYLQEDNIARAYFRIRPLLTEEGLVRPEDLAGFPDEGYLRIVPDKNEQHTFKERMRSLCGLCMMDLRFLPAEANKIRTNKNYYPARGEVNQYIIYSDAVRALPNDLMYQVVSEENIAQAHTPYVYLRKGANIQGPVNKETAQPEGELNALPPDSEGLFAVTVDEQELLFYWPKSQKPAAAAEAQNPEAPAEAKAEPVKAAPAEAPALDAISRIQEMNAALHEDIRPMKETKQEAEDYIPREPAKPLVGTRLYQAPGRPAAQRRAHNPLMEAVEQQRYASRYEAPGAVIAPATEMKDVQNPMDAFKRALQSVCQTPEAQKQAVEAMVRQPGMKSLLNKALCANHQSDATLSAMQAQLQELEAERLMTLMQLDDVKKNLSAARDEAIGQMTAQEEEKLNGLKAAKEAEEKALQEMRDALTGIEKQRDEAAAVIEAAEKMQGRGVLIPAAGEDCEKDEMISRVKACFEAAGFDMDAEDALQLLILVAQAEGRLEMTADTRADAQTAAFTLAAALGAAAVSAGCTGLAGEPVRPRILPGGNAPVFVVDPEDCLSATAGAITISLNRNGAEDAFVCEDYGVCPFASMDFKASAERLPASLPVFPAVRMDSLRKAVLPDSPLSPDTVSALNVLRRALADSGVALPLNAVKKMAAFMAAGQNCFRGGVAEALDRAALCYAVPHIRAYGLDQENILSAVAGMPRTARQLKERNAL